MKLSGKTILANKSYAINYQNIGAEAFSVNERLSIVGVFNSHILDGGSDLINWNEINWTSQNLGNTTVLFYTKSGSSDNLDGEWSGPYSEGEISISDITSRYLQIRTVICLKHKDVYLKPLIKSITVSNFKKSSTGTFSLNTLDLGFRPEYAVLTFNAKENDSVFQFAMSGEDTGNLSDYQLLEPNKINKLTDVSELATQAKLMFQASGRPDAPFELNNFSFILIGSGKKRLNG